MERKKVISLAAFAFALYGSELFLAIVLSRDWVSNATILVSFADSLKQFFPVIGNFDRIARYPEGLRVFLAISILLLPVKMLLIYKFLTAFDRLYYRHFIVSPLSRDKVLKPSDAKDVASGVNCNRNNGQRSLLSVAFASFMIVLFAVGMLFVMSRYGLYGAGLNNDWSSALGTTVLKTREIARGGLPAWFAWSCTQMTFSALVATIAFCVIRDWIVFIFQKIRGH